MGSELRFEALERRRAGALAWVLVAVVVAGVVGAVAWGLTRTSASGAVVAELAGARAELAEARATAAERARLLAQADDEAALLRAPGQAAALLYRVAAEATESGVVLGDPARHAARLYLYGLAAPRTAGEYVAVARGADGARAVLGRVLPDDVGSAFLLARGLPEGTEAIELALRPPGREAVEAGDVRVSARFPRGPDQRGVLQPQPVQARQGHR